MDDDYGMRCVSCGAIFEFDHGDTYGDEECPDCGSWDVVPSGDSDA